MGQGLTGQAGCGKPASRRAIACALATAVIVAGALFVRSVSRRPGSTVAAIVTGGSSRSEVVDQDAPISARLVLDQTVVDEGATIRGFVEIANPTGQAVTVRVCDLDTWPTVFLASAALQYEHPMSAALCNGGATLAPGVTRQPVTVSTTYPSCTYPDIGFSATPARPFCVGTTDPPSQLPPLPPGQYTAVIEMPTMTHPLDLPAPSAVTLR